MFKRLFIVFFASFILNISLLPFTPLPLWEASAGIVTKAAKAYLSTRLIKMMFIGGTNIARKKAHQTFFDIIKNKPDLAPQAYRMVLNFKNSPKFAQHLSSSRGKELRSEMETVLARLNAWNKPSSAESRKLKNILDGAHRKPSNKATVGSGSTADALRHEKATGSLVRGKNHLEKAETTKKSITDWLTNEGPGASKEDLSRAIKMLDDLKDALRK